MVKCRQSSRQACQGSSAGLTRRQQNRERPAAPARALQVPQTVASCRATQAWGLSASCPAIFVLAAAPTGHCGRWIFEPLWRPLWCHLPRGPPSGPPRIPHGARPQPCLRNSWPIGFGGAVCGHVLALGGASGSGVALRATHLGPTGGAARRRASPRDQAAARRRRRRLEPAHQVAHHQDDVGHHGEPVFLMRQVARYVDADGAELGDERQARQQ